MVFGYAVEDNVASTSAWHIPRIRWASLSLLIGTLVFTVASTLANFSATRHMLKVVFTNTVRHTYIRGVEASLLSGLGRSRPHKYNS